MSIKNIISDIEKAGTQTFEQLTDRRDLLKDLGTKVVTAALPFSIGSLFNTTPAKNEDSIVDVLNTELEYEYLEYAFYRTANNTSGLIPQSDKAGFQTIEAHEKGHINFLVNAVAQLGGTPFRPAGALDSHYAPGAFNFTKGGVYPVFSDYTTFLMVAQAIENSGIRATTRHMETFAGSPLFAQMQQIATTESRHAAFAKSLRRSMYVPNAPEQWLSNNFAPKDAHRFEANYQSKSQFYHVA